MSQWNWIEKLWRLSYGSFTLCVYVKCVPYKFRVSPYVTMVTSSHSFYNHLTLPSRIHYTGSRLQSIRLQQGYKEPLSLHQNHRQQGQKVRLQWASAYNEQLILHLFTRRERNPVYFQLFLSHHVSQSVDFYWMSLMLKEIDATYKHVVGTHPWQLTTSVFIE